MDILLAFEKCVGEDRFLPATFRFIQRTDSARFLQSLGREVHMAPTLIGKHEVELQFLETLAKTIGVDNLYTACVEFQAFAERREAERREAMLQAEEAAAALILRSTITLTL